MKHVQVKAYILQHVEFTTIVNDNVRADVAATAATYERYPDAIEVEVREVNAMKHSGIIQRDSDFCDDPLYCPICKAHFKDEITL